MSRVKGKRKRRNTTAGQANVLFNKKTVTEEVEDVVQRRVSVQISKTAWAGIEVVRKRLG